MTLLVLLLACRADLPGVSVPTDPVDSEMPTVTNTGTTTTQPTAATGSTSPTGRLDTGSSASTGTLATAETGAATGATATTGDTAASTVTATSGHTAHSAPTAHTGASTDSASGHTGDTALCGVLPPDLEPVLIYPEEATITEEVCYPTGGSDTAGTAGHTGATMPHTCPQLQWVIHAEGPHDGSMTDMVDLPGGDVIVAGHDEFGVTFAPGTANETVLPGLGYAQQNSYILRVALDGSIVWALRFSTTPLTVLRGVHTLPNGNLLVWGSTYNSSTPATLLPGEPTQASLNEAVKSAYWAEVEPDGQLVQVHQHADEDTLEFGEVTVGDDGSIYVRGEFEGSLTFNVGEADELTIEGEEESPIDWLAAWGPDGSFRWVKTEADTPHAFATNALLPRDGELEVHYVTGGASVWHPCTPYETVIPEVVLERDGTVYDNQGVTVVVSYDAETGLPTGPARWVPDTTPHGQRTPESDAAHGRFGAYYAVAGQVVAGQAVSYGGIVALDEDLIAVQPLTTGGYPPMPLANLRARDDLVLGFGSTTFGEYTGATLEWTCAEPLEVEPFSVSSSSAKRHTWQTFRASDLQPLCNGDMGVGTGFEGVLDAEGGMVLAVLIRAEHTYGVGEPNETTVVPDQADIVIVRYAP